MSNDVITGTIDSALLAQVESLAQAAGRATLEIYTRRSELDVTLKMDDSPVTEADLAAHRVLLEGLPEILEVPVLSEESEVSPYEVRSQWWRYWLVDPLDGTKEFLSGSGEFTVNVALIEDGCPVLGVVAVPVTGVVYSGAKGLGAYRDGAEIRVRPVVSDKKTVIVTSRRHNNEQSQAALVCLEQYFDGIELLQVGSSLKFCQIAEGAADCYPRLAPTNEWDTAAAQAVLEAAGGQVMNLDGNILSYNQKAELLNPYFVAVGDASMPWLQIINCD